MVRARARAGMIAGVCAAAAGAVMVLPVPTGAVIRAEMVGLEPLPKTPQGNAARAFVAMYNEDGDEVVRAFERDYRARGTREQVPIEERLRRVKQLRLDMGRLEITELLESTPGSLTCMARDARGHVLVLGFVFSKDEPGRVEGVELRVGDESVRPRMLTPPQMEEVVEGVCSALEEEYVFPEVAAKMASAVRERLGAGEYAAYQLESSLARKLTDDLRAVSHDKHLGVRLSPRPSDGEQMQAPAADPAKENFAFKRVEVLPGNIGYVRFDGFIESPEAQKTATAAMQFVAHCDAVVFDLRHNGGGSPEMIRFITSYLYAEPTHLNDMVDRGGKVVEEYWTLEDVPGERLRAGIPVYVLTSGYTFSGAEEFSYNLKNLKRATIVGETTGGGAHPVKGVRVNDRFMVGVPFMRAQNPISKDNWEGKGVAPDIEAPAERALDEALEHARAALAGGAD